MSQVLAMAHALQDIQVEGMPPIVYSARYEIDLGGHVFPTRKYPLTLQAVIERGTASPGEVLEPEPASWADLSLVHTRAYLDKLRLGGLRADEEARLELPWSPAVVEGFRLMVGGTILAAERALQTGGVVVHLGGGFHHACPDHGEGFCMFHDVAVAVRRLQRDGRIARAAIVDCDVHHGNGTAFMLGGDDTVYTFSIDQDRNYPDFKPPGTLDIHLPDGTGDESYLEHLAGALPGVFASHPEIAFYLAGADPFEEDQLGGLSLTKEGLRRRDRLVFASARQAGVPVVVTLAGGYARRLSDTVDIHAATVEEAARAFSDLTAATGPRPS